MVAAKAHPYLVSFCKIRLVEQNPRTGRYQLGALALRLGLAGLAQSPALRRAEEALGPFKQKVQHTVALAVWGQLGPTIVQLSAVDFPLETNLRVGSVMSMVSTATGRVFATYMQPTVTERLVEIELQRLALASADQALEKARLMKEIAETRTRGMARAMGNPIPGVNALAAPILGANGHLDLVVLVFGREENFDARWGGSIATALADYCSAVSRD